MTVARSTRHSQSDESVAAGYSALAQNVSLCTADRRNKNSIADLEVRYQSNEKHLPKRRTSSLASERKHFASYECQQGKEY